MLARGAEAAVRHHRLLAGIEAGPAGKVGVPVWTSVPQMHPESSSNLIRSLNQIREFLGGDSQFELANLEVVSESRLCRLDALCGHAAASSVAPIAWLLTLPASLHRTHPSRPDRRT